MSASKKIALLVATSLAVALLWAAVASAATILPANNSFENPIVASDPGYYNYNLMSSAPPSWSTPGIPGITSGSAARITAYASAPAAGVTGGTDLEYVNLYGGTGGLVQRTGIYQTLDASISGSTIVADTQYQLLADLTQEPTSILNNFGAANGSGIVTITLSAWDGSVETVIGSTDIPGTEIDALAGTYRTYTTPLTVPASTLIGQQLRVTLKEATSTAIAPQPGTGYAGFGFCVDNVRIDSVATSVFFPGDADRNGTVNGADLNTVLSNYNGTFTGDTWALGDFDGNSTVNGADLNIVLSNYDQHLAAAGAPGAPEPSTLLLAAAGLAGLLGYAWRKRK
jgi:hypothetical protein